MAASSLSRRIAPLSYSGKDGVVVADWLAATAADGAPLCRDNDRGLHMSGRSNDKCDLDFTRELIV